MTGRQEALDAYGERVWFDKEKKSLYAIVGLGLAIIVAIPVVDDVVPGGQADNELANQMLIKIEEIIDMLLGKCPI